MREYVDLVVRSREAHEEALSVGFFTTGYGQIHLMDSLKNTKKNCVNLFQPSSDKELREAIKKVNILLNPISPERQVITPTNATLMKDRNVIVVFTLKHFLSFSGVSRVKYMRSAIITGRILKKKRIPVVLSSGAETVYDVKTPRQIISFGELFELDYPQCVYGVTELPKYLVSRCEGNL